MLLSMTGFGEAKTHEEGVTLISEVKTVNNRFFKMNLRLPDLYAPLESRVEAMIRQYVDRGTINLSVRIIQDSVESDYAIDTNVLKSYVRDLISVCNELGMSGADSILSRSSLGDLLQLPGVVRERLVERGEDFLEKNWKHLSANLSLAFHDLQTMRRTEGESMLIDLRTNIAELTTMIDRVEKLSPAVVESYRVRLTELVERVMTERNLPSSPGDVVREVALFADKSDVSEEVVRFRSHLNQFNLALSGTDRCGKKLDFLVQELNREANTIGSKGNCAEITTEVVGMKSTIERIREMIQNIE